MSNTAATVAPDRDDVPILAITVNLALDESL